jgi:hypothetical protein
VKFQDKPDFGTKVTDKTAVAEITQASVAMFMVMCTEDICRKYKEGAQNL